MERKRDPLSRYIYYPIRSPGKIAHLMNEALACVERDFQPIICFVSQTEFINCKKHFKLFPCGASLYNVQTKKLYQRMDGEFYNVCFI